MPLRGGRGPCWPPGFASGHEVRRTTRWGYARCRLGLRRLEQIPRRRPQWGGSSRRPWRREGARAQRRGLYSLAGSRAGTGGGRRRGGGGGGGGGGGACGGRERRGRFFNLLRDVFLPCCGTHGRERARSARDKIVGLSYFLFYSRLFIFIFIFIYYFSTVRLHPESFLFFLVFSNPSMSCARWTWIARD